MAKVFITLTGTKHYFGNDFLEKGTKIRLEKEPDNEYDKEAIKVIYEGLGKERETAYLTERIRRLQERYNKLALNT